MIKHPDCLGLTQKEYEAMSSNRNFTQEEWEKFWKDCPSVEGDGNSEYIYGSIGGDVPPNTFTNDKETYEKTIPVRPIIEWRYNKEAYEWEPYRKEDLTNEGEDNKPSWEGLDNFPTANIELDNIKQKHIFITDSTGTGLIELMPTPPEFLSIDKAEDGKQKPSLAGLPPKVLEQEAQVMSFGGNKYYFGKWVKEPTTQYKRIDSAMRHINKWLQGIDLDDESSLPHLVHAIVQLTMAQEYANRGISDGRSL